MKGKGSYSAFPGKIDPSVSQYVMEYGKISD
jgi:hypothetical protein